MCWNLQTYTRGYYIEYTSYIMYVLEFTEVHGDIQEAIIYSVIYVCICRDIQEYTVMIY